VIAGSSRRRKEMVKPLQPEVMIEEEGESKALKWRSLWKKEPCSKGCCKHFQLRIGSKENNKISQRMWVDAESREEKEDAQKVPEERTNDTKRSSSGESLMRYWVARCETCYRGGLMQLTVGKEKLTKEEMEMTIDSHDKRFREKPQQEERGCQRKLAESRWVKRNLTENLLS
jgi:hypothetical protein